MTLKIKKFLFHIVWGMDVVYYESRFWTMAIIQTIRFVSLLLALLSLVLFLVTLVKLWK